MYLRLRSMEGRVGVAHILCRLEHAEGQGGEEISSGEQAGGRAQREAGVLAQEVAHAIQLRDAVRDEDISTLQLSKRRLVLCTSVFGHQVQHGVEDPHPGSVLRLSVCDVRDRVVVFVCERDLSNLLPALPVVLISEARMVHVQLWLKFGHQVVAVVQIGSVTREPRSLR